MQPFEYASPKTLKEATALLGSNWADAAVLGGGTDLISLMKDGVVTPKRLVNIKEIAELKGIGSKSNVLRIGAATTVDELMEDKNIRKSWPALHQAAAEISSPQIRNMGTVGGDLCQRPRCWYFRGGYGLLGMNEGRSLITNGENKYHAIFGDGPAKFVSASSFGPALVALNAKLKLVSATGNREVEASKFFISPQNDTAREIALMPNEILTEILIPGSSAKTATYEVRHKDALDWPLVTASVALTMKGSSVGAARIVLGHVAPTPWEVPAAGEALVGKSINEENAEAAGKAAVAGAKPLSGNGYKVQLAKVAVKRAVLLAANQLTYLRSAKG